MFYVLNKVTLVTEKFERANSVAAWLLGRKLKNYIIVKDDKVYIPTTGDCFLIQKELEAL